MPKSFFARMLCRFTFASKVYTYVKCHSLIRPTCSVKFDKLRSQTKNLIPPRPRYAVVDIAIFWSDFFRNRNFDKQWCRPFRRMWPAADTSSFSNLFHLQCKTLSSMMYLKRHQLAAADVHSSLVDSSYWLVSHAYFLHSRFLHFTHFPAQFRRRAWFLCIQEEALPVLVHLKVHQLASSPWWSSCHYQFRE